MRGSLLAVLVALGGLVVLSCTGDRAPLPPREPSVMGPAAPVPPVNRGQVEDLIPKLFPPVALRQQANDRLTSIHQALLDGDTVGAQRQARDFVAFAGQLLADDRLLHFLGGPPDPFLQQFVRSLFAFVGITGLEQDGAVEVVDSGGKTLVTAPLRHAGVRIPGERGRRKFLLVISLLPADAPPLSTPLRQIPPFYEFSPNPPLVLPASNKALVGLCQDDAAVADIPDHYGRIRIAHLVSTPLGGVEVLDYAFPDFLENCANPPPGPPSQGGLLERLLLPRRLHAAAVAHGGAGGSVESFSPFVAVDIGSIDP